MRDEETKLNYVDVGSARTVPPEWVIENLLIKGLTVIGAPPKAGKSTWTMVLAALIADWHCKALPRFLTKVKKPGPTLVLSAEATAGELRHTLEAGLRTKTKADGNILIMEDPTDCQLDDKDGLRNLMHDLKVLDPRLCILDPFREFHSLEEKDSAGMVKLLKPVRKWAVENDAAFAVVHHTTKPPAGDRKDWKYSGLDLRGSGAILGKVDGLLMLTPKTEGDTINVHLNAIFKRAKPFATEIRLAAWDSELQEGCEVLKPIDKTVLKAIQKGLKLTAIQAQLQLGSRAMQEIVEKLTRNGLTRKAK